MYFVSLKLLEHKRDTLNFDEVDTTVLYGFLLLWNPKRFSFLVSQIIQLMNMGFTVTFNYVTLFELYDIMFV
jgi:hypothetical protein